MEKLLFHLILFLLFLVLRSGLVIGVQSGVAKRSCEINGVPLSRFRSRHRHPPADCRSIPDSTRCTRPYRSRSQQWPTRIGKYIIQSDQSSNQFSHISYYYRVLRVKHLTGAKASVRYSYFSFNTLLSRCE